MDERLKNKRGITLIALVITIVILLILAGISIAALGGENGLFAKAEEAKKKYEISEYKEKIEMSITDLIIENQSKGKHTTKEDLTKINSEEIDVRDVDNFPVEVICDIYKFSVDENFRVTYIGEVDETVITYVTVPNKYTNEDEIKITIKAINQKGMKTIQVANEDVEQLNNAKEKVVEYIVNKNGTYKVVVIDNEGKKVEKDIVIDLIDKLKPVDFTPEVEKNGSNITITSNVQDAEPDGTSTKSGIDYCEYYLKSEDKSEYTKYETNQITGLATGKYQLYVIAYDKAGNYKQSNTVEVNIVIPLEKIASGYSHGLGIDKEGNLLAWGDNSDGQLGNGTTKGSTVEIQIREGIKFKEISAGNGYSDFFSTALDEDGNIFICGTGKYGMYGNSLTIGTSFLSQMTYGTKFIQISAGYNHCLALDENGGIWSWGEGLYGKLGDGTTEERNRPKKVKIENVKFTQIVAGYGHSLAIDEEGNLWGCGSDSNKCLGGIGSTKEFLKISNGIQFVQIEAGHDTTLALDVDGNIWGCGLNDHGQLGDGTKSMVDELKQITNNIKFKQISSKSYFSSYALDESGDLWSCGYGHLGDGSYRNSDNEVTLFTKMKEGLKLKEIKAGESDHFSALDETGNLWSCGYNGYRNLLNVTQSELLELTKVR